MIQMTLALPPVADPLGEALHFLRMSGMLYCRSEFTEPWALELPPMDDFLMLHAITSGQCWLEVAGAENRLLQAGDVVLVPHGEGHQLASACGMKGAKLFELPREPVSERYEILRLGGCGSPTTAVCAVFQFDHPAARQLVALLPKVIAVDSQSTPHLGGIQSLLQMMTAEAGSLHPGGETVITRVADILVIHAIRAWISQDPAAQTGWLGALQDKQIGRIISLIHREPARAWNLDSLAAEAAMSRSAFAARFSELVGEPAMYYVTRWRMNTALNWLRGERVTVGELSRRLGYESEAAFTRALKIYTGVAPGAARRQSSALPNKRAYSPEGRRAVKSRARA